MRTRLMRAAVALVVIAALWFALAPLGFGSWHHPLDETPADHGLAFETVTFQPRDEPRLLLRAWWMTEGIPKAGLVMVHGGGGNRAQPFTDWLQLAGTLAQHGYGVLALDLRNHGESSDTPGGPTFGPDEANDVIAAIDFLQRRNPGMRFAAIGHSMGGQTALYAAARDPRLEAVISDSTYTDIASITPAFAHAATGLPSLLFGAPFIWSAQHLHGLALDQAHAVDVIGSLAPRPVLLIHNAADPIVPLEQARALAQAYPGAELWITSTPDAELPPALRTRFGTHARSYTLNPAAYADRVTQFLDRTFAAPPSPGATAPPP
jgi:pimeloyl-ACP methyl ester carboxylesterase